MARVQVWQIMSGGQRPPKRRPPRANVAYPLEGAVKLGYRNELAAIEDDPIDVTAARRRGASVL